MFVPTNQLKKHEKFKTQHPGDGTCDGIVIM